MGSDLFVFIEINLILAGERRSVGKELRGNDLDLLIIRRNISIGQIQVHRHPYRLRFTNFILY